MSNRRRGSSAVEVALMMPWIVFLFVGVLDFGFYSYAAISVENAARVAALYNSNSGSGAYNDSTGACFYVLQELKNLPNIGTSVTTCTASDPVQVTASTATVPDGAGGNTPAVQVTVTYQSPNMIPLPTLTKVLNITRTVYMRQ
jgi:Flp pilus assembly protein TadG